VDAKSLELDNEKDNRPVKLFFHDEARFGRIDKSSSCWVPPGCRAIVGNQIIRKYTYVYLAVCPETGENFSLILPYVNQSCMKIFMDGLSDKFNDYKMVMVMDRATWHKKEKYKSTVYFVRSTSIVPLFQPAYSPEVNPVENIWHHIRESGGFKNTTFQTLEEVELRLAEKLINLDEKTLQSITGFNWIKQAVFP
jgi:transposase